MSEIQGKPIAKKILADAKRRAAGLRRPPILSVLLVGKDAASAKYVERKAAAATEAGVDCRVQEFPASIAGSALASELIRIQHRSDAVVVQLPLPEHIDRQEILDEIELDKDADCLSSRALGAVARGASKILPPTAAAVLEILREHSVDLAGKHVVVVGQGELVGKPLAAVLLNAPVTLTICGLGTGKLSDYTKKADILVTGAGQPGLISADMVKKGAVVIDAGAGMAGGRLAGDVDYEKAVKKAGLITPVPGGVGPVTVAKLLSNVVTLAEK